MIAKCRRAPFGIRIPGKKVFKTKRGILQRLRIIYEKRLPVANVPGWSKIEWGGEMSSTGHFIQNQSDAQVVSWGLSATQGSWPAGELLTRPLTDVHSNSVNGASVLASIIWTNKRIEPLTTTFYYVSTKMGPAKAWTDNRIEPLSSVFAPFT